MINVHMCNVYHLFTTLFIGNFSPGEENGTIIKKSSQDESLALQRLMDDVLRPHVPEFKREIVKESDGECVCI